MKSRAWLLTLVLVISIINYPNPFNPKGKEVMTFESSSSATQESTLMIYDLAAQLIFRKSFSLTGGATSRLTWNGYSNYNELVGTGLYLYRLINASTNQSLAKGKIWVINN